MQLSKETFLIPVEQKLTDHKKLGKAPAKGSTKLLLLANFLKAAPDVVVPATSSFWRDRQHFPLETYGNTQYGCCTRASQALLAMRMERLEQRRTIEFDDDEIIRVYLEMTERLYGGGDTGAYETDALDCWRKKDLTFRDRKGRPHTIDAYLGINYRNINEIKKAMFLAGAHGIKLCFNLPLAWSSTYHWDIPQGQLPVGEYEPGSWGGHSMMAYDYDDEGIFLAHSWGVPDGKVTWRGVMQYCDEAYIAIDSVNEWKKKKKGEIIDLDAVVSEVNAVSSQKIEIAS
jgi:hypothetical protein